MPGLNDWITLKYDKVTCTCALDFSAVELLPKEDSIDYTIEKITERYDNLYVCLSGGIDSEFMANCLLSRGIKFTPVIVDFEGNRLEAWYAYLWCKRNNIEPRVISLPLQMAAAIFQHYAVKHSTAFVSGMEFVLNTLIDGHLLFGSADPFFVQPGIADQLADTTPLNLEISSYDFALDLAYPRVHPGSFFAYTPTLMVTLATELDYSKPVQLAKAEYYGVNPRPKVSAYVNTKDIAEIAAQVNSSVPLYTIKLGARDTFLEIVKNRGTVTHEVNYVKNYNHLHQGA